MEIVNTVCHRNCPDTCFVNATVVNGKIIKTKGSSLNPVTRGFICPRGSGDPKRVYSKQRVLYPHIKSDRQDAEQFVRVSWDNALTHVSKNLKKAMDTYGNDSILLYDYPGNQGFLAWQFPRRLWFALGAATTDYSLCSSSGHAGIGLHYGLTYGVQPEELAKAQAIIFWGNNAKVSSPHQWALALEARKNQNAIIISVDPRKSPTSEAADIRIRPRPGSDVALCYGIAEHLIRKNGVDLEFINKWTSGYKAYLDEALKWTPERVEQVSGVSGNLIDNICEKLVAGRPSVFMIGLGLQKSIQGAEAARAVSLLPALLGYHRGFHYSDANGRFIDWSYISGDSLTTNKGKVVNQVSIGERLEAGEFKFVFILGTNPAVTLPNLSAVRRGLNREDVFVVVQDTHWSDTTAFADVVLPAATYLEKTDINFSDHHLYSRLSNKVIEPLGESKSEIWVMQQLAKTIGLKQKWLFENPWKALQEAFRDTYKEGELQDILEGAVLELNLRPFNEYQTPSGKIEFVASKASDIGIQPLPSQDRANIDREWFILLNSAIPKYTHSQFTDVYGPIPQIVWINLKDAKKLGIRDGEIVRIFNELGTVTLNAQITDKVSMGTLWAPRPLTGLNGIPLNILVPGTPQEIGGGPVFNSVKVKIKR